METSRDPGSGATSACTQLTSFVSRGTDSFRGTDAAHTVDEYESGVVAWGTWVMVDSVGTGDRPGIVQHPRPITTYRPLLDMFYVFQYLVAAY